MTTLGHLQCETPALPRRNVRPSIQHGIRDLNNTPKKPRTRLTDVVIQTLSERLDTQVYRPGQRLPSEQALCKEFKVSRTVIREAMASLRLGGRVVSSPGLGVFVTEDHDPPISFDIQPPADSRWALHIMEVRVGLEVEAAGLAAERRTPANMADIVQAFDEFNAAESDRAAAVQADFNFHLAIARASNNPHFAHLLESAVKDVMLDLKIKHGGKSEQELRDYEKRTAREHGVIMAAIMRGDPGAARAAMTRHLGESVARYRKQLAAKR